MKKLIQTAVSSSKAKLRPYGSEFQQRYPKLYRLISVLKDGSTRFTKETILYFKIKYRLWKDPNYLNSMTWNQVETYKQIPRDWKKVAPVMIISAFPFLNYIVLPIAYAYPHKLLCRQFWTLEQILKFGELDYYNKLKLYNPLLDHLQIHAEQKLADDIQAKNVLIDLLEKIKNGHGASKSEVLELKPILNRPEFNLKKLSLPHLQLLVKLDNCRRVFNFNPYTNLVHYAYWLKEVDRKLITTDLNKLPIEYIYNMCFERGINSRSHSINDLVLNLRYWLEFSDALFALRDQVDNKIKTQENFTLYLYSKILLKSSLNQKHGVRNNQY